MPACAVNWFLFAVLGTALFGLIALTDKYMLTVHFKDWVVYAWITGVSGGMLALLGMAVIGSTTGLSLPGGWLAVWLLAPGVLLSLAGFAYMRALSASAAPLVVAYSQLTPVFALALGFWVLSESLSAMQLFGMLIVVGAAVALALGRAPDDDEMPQQVASTALFALGAALPLMLLSSGFRAASDLLLKQRTEDAGVMVAYLVSRQGVLICGLGLLLHVGLRHRIIVGLRAVTAGAWARLTVLQVGATSSFYLLAIALNRGPLALVSVISSNVTVFTVAYAVLFGRLLRMPNVPSIGIAWQRLLACLALMALGTAALRSSS